jgi:hypothetical protein
VDIDSSGIIRHGVVLIGFPVAWSRSAGLAAVELLFEPVAELLVMGLVGPVVVVVLVVVLPLVLVAVVLVAAPLVLLVALAPVALVAEALLALVDALAGDDASPAMPLPWESAPLFVLKEADAAALAAVAPLPSRPLVALVEVPPFSGVPLAGTQTMPSAFGSRVCAGADSSTTAYWLSSS